MIAGLKKIDGFVRDAVHEAVFLGDPTRPTTRKKISQWLRLT